MIMQDSGNSTHPRDQYEGDCVIFEGYTERGGHGVLSRGNKQWKAHRWAWTQQVGPIPEGMQVNHKCDVPACTNVDHLVLGTNADNVEDRVRRGRQIQGETNGRVTLTENHVLAIRMDSRSAVELAQVYGVHAVQIRRIRNRKQWAHVQ